MPDDVEIPGNIFFMPFPRVPWWRRLWRRMTGRKPATNPIYRKGNMMPRTKVLARFDDPIVYNSVIVGAHQDSGARWVALLPKEERSDTPDLPSDKT